MIKDGGPYGNSHLIRFGDGTISICSNLLDAQPTVEYSMHILHRSTLWGEDSYDFLDKRLLLRGLRSAGARFD